MLGQVRIAVLAFWVVNSHQFAPAQALVKRGAEQREPESWEITKRYGEGWLHKQFLLHEGLPEKITVPAVEATVVDADGAPAAGAGSSPTHRVTGCESCRT